MNYIVKQHGSGSNNIVLAIIDEELFGKKIEEGNKILDLNVNFYKGEKKSEEETLAIINHANHLNIVGNKIVAFLKSKKLIDVNLKINGVSYAQVAIVRN